MKKGNNKNTLTFFILFIIVCVFLVIVFLYFKTEGQLFSQVVQNITEFQSVKDNYNGVYTNIDSLNGTKTLFRNCTLTHIDNHILIINKDYYVYRSSCIGTFYLDSGKVKDLDIHEDLEKNTFYIKYDDKVYNKDYATTTLEVTTQPLKYEGDFYSADYQLLFKESQFENFYYDISGGIYGSSSELKINFKHLESESFEMTLKLKDEILYQYYIKDFESLPMIYTFGGYVVIIEKNEETYKYNNTLKIFSNDGLVYNLDDMFPIIVDDVVLNNEKSIYILFNSSERNFRVIVSESKEICQSDDTKEVAYYEFKIDYNYSKKSFSKPSFVKLGYASSECKDISEIVGG